MRSVHFAIKYYTRRYHYGNVAIVGIGSRSDQSPTNGKFKYAVDQMRTSADGINGNVEERARGAERSEALDEFAEQFVQLQRIISLYKSLIKKDIDAIETTGEQLKEIDLKLEGVWKGLQMLK